MDKSPTSLCIALFIINHSLWELFCEFDKDENKFKPKTLSFYLCKMYEEI